MESYCILFSSTLVLLSIEWVTVVSYSNWSILLLVACKCAVRLQGVPLQPQAESPGWWCSKWVYPNRSWSAECHREVCWVLLGYIHNISEIFELVENRLYAYAADSSLPAVVHKPADRPAVADSLNMDLARIQEWCNHWCVILNHSKTKDLVASRFRTVNHPHGDLVLSGVSIFASPNLNIFGVKFDSRLTFEDYVRSIVSRVAERIGILRLVKRVFVDTSLLLRCYYAFVLPILEYCSPVWESAVEFHLELLER